jgi:carbamoyltransferase
MEHIRGGSLHYFTTCNVLGRRTDCLMVAHEASHAALSCHFADYVEPGMVLVNEGRGSFSRNSFFLLKNGKLILKDTDMLPWYGSGFGWSALGYIFGYGISPSTAGKIMALGGYGTYSETFHEILMGIEPRVHHRDREFQEQEVRKLLDHKEFKKDFYTMAAITATFQQMFNREVLKLVQSKLEEFDSRYLALGGGCGLNLVVNTLLRKKLTRDIAVSPVCNDAGQALGAGIYAQKFCLGIQPEPFTIYSNGLACSNQVIEHTLDNHRLVSRPYDPIYLARRLAEGEVAAFFNGVSELGPRALGNRSLLANPCIKGMKQRLSEGIKEREWFRPLAPVMRLERFHELFPGELPSPYMLFCYPTPGNLMPEATHIDGTSRIQTVTEGENPLLHNLLAEFEKQTGIPALVNTSLNRRNKAITYSVQDVLQDFLDADIDLFIFEDRIVFNHKRRETAPR